MRSRKKNPGRRHVATEGPSPVAKMEQRPSPYRTVRVAVLAVLEKPRGARRDIPLPTESVVYDRIYWGLLETGLVKWHRERPHMASLSDYLVLTPLGRKALASARGNAHRSTSRNPNRAAPKPKHPFSPAGLGRLRAQAKRIHDSWRLGNGESGESVMSEIGYVDVEVDERGWWVVSRGTTTYAEKWS